MLKELDEFNWEHVFAYADGVDREDVGQILALHEGENDADAWVLLAQLKSGRFLAIQASCDYTGWGCREGGESATADTIEVAILELGWPRDLTVKDFKDGENVRFPVVESDVRPYLSAMDETGWTGSPVALVDFLQERSDLRWTAFAGGDSYLWQQLAKTLFPTTED